MWILVVLDVTVCCYPIYQFYSKLSKARLASLWSLTLLPPVNLSIILWKGSAGSIMYGSDLKLKTICVTINTYTCKYTSKIYTSEESNKICS